MRLLSRLSYPWRSSNTYEWAESGDLLLERKLGINRSWLQPLERPIRTDLPSLEKGFDGRSATVALDLLANHRAEIANLPCALSLNGFFGPADVAFYWSFIRARRPNTIIEVGSGYSSRVALRALAKNGQGRLICIDPTPRLELPKRNLAHVAAKIEDVDPSLFDNLRPNDIVFIDSSHFGAEVKHHASLLERLPAGALVHYHDIDYPWPRQKPEWDEDAVVNAFLSSHSNWKVIVNGSVLSRDSLPQLRGAIPGYDRTPYRRYNGLWITRTE